MPVQSQECNFAFAVFEPMILPFDKGLSVLITLTVSIFLYQMRISTIHVSSLMLVVKIFEIQSLYKR